jgi:hypothetical protein
VAHRGRKWLFFREFAAQKAPIAGVARQKSHDMIKVEVSPRGNASAPDRSRLENFPGPCINSRTKLEDDCVFALPDDDKPESPEADPAGIAMQA